MGADDEMRPELRWSRSMQRLHHLLKRKLHQRFMDVFMPPWSSRLIFLLVAPVAITCAAPNLEDVPGSNIAPDAGGMDASLDADEMKDAAMDAAPTDGGEPFDAGPSPCGEVNQFGPIFADIIARFSAQDSIGGWPDNPVVFVGSSSIRRWENLAHAYTDYSPLQRGFGGAQLGEVTHYAHELVGRHNPRAIVLYAGTNDVDAGVAPNVVVDRFRCFRYRIGEELGWNRPIVFISIVPNPARWDQWPKAKQVNEAIAAIASNDPSVYYADVASLFLTTGSPPQTSLFVADQLHLSPEGYDLLNSAVRPVVEMATTPTPLAGPPIPASPAGTRLLIDLGSSNPEDGELTPSPDYLGQHWNNWHSIDGGMAILPGEQIVNMISTDGTKTAIDLVIAGGFSNNGRSNGGLLWPDGAKLGNLAVGSATGDFFYTDGPDLSGGLWLRDLDPAKSYTFRMFAARQDAEVRVTRYTMIGATTASATVQTTGPGAGSAGATTNDDTIVEFKGVKPDAWGHVFIDVANETGPFAYLSLIEMIVEE